MQDHRSTIQSTALIRHKDFQNSTSQIADNQHFSSNPPGISTFLRSIILRNYRKAAIPMDTFTDSEDSNEYRITTFSDLEAVAKKLSAKDKHFLSHREKALLVLHRSRQSREFLSLSGFAELPPEIALFKNLLELRIVKSSLTSLPREISKLTNLRRLYLDNNLLASLPSEIGSLKAL